MPKSCFCAPDLSEADKESVLSKDERHFYNRVAQPNSTELALA
jgi:hypothetical protein